MTETTSARRMILSGFPCSKLSWERLLPSGPTDRFVSLAELLKETPRVGLREMSRTAATLIEAHRPESLVLHDLGVVVGLLGLLRARKRDPSIRPKVTIFNGAFRGFNVFQATHPFKIQLLSFAAVAKIVRRAGGEMDPALEPMFGKIKKLYRQLITASVWERAQALTGFRRKLSIGLGNQVLILGSSNDPFIPASALKSLMEDLQGCRLETINYGHFPYAGDVDRIRKRVLLFEVAS